MEPDNPGARAARPGYAGGVVDDGDGHELRHVQPYQATKRYVCPGCSHPIEAGTGHLVAVPVDEPDLRRHWHTPCWRARDRRRPR